MDAFDIKYIFPDDYNPKYANGAWGGISPRGDLIVNFFLERMPLPTKETYELRPEGNLGQRLNSDPEGIETTMIRFIQSGLVLNLENAISIHQWLGNKIEEMAKQKKE